MIKYGAARALASFLLVLTLLSPSCQKEGEIQSPGPMGPMDPVLGVDVGDYEGVRTLISPDERGWIRHFKLEIRWEKAQPKKDSFSWEYYDRQIKAAIEDGAQSILLLIGGPVPAWARDGKYGSLSRKAPPKDLADWYRFCSQVAERYGKVVDLYEIWNEPGWDADGEGMRLFNTSHFGGQVETDYLPLLRTASQAIREADPGAILVGGALIDTLTDNPSAGGELIRSMAGGGILATSEVGVKVEGEVIPSRRAAYTSLSEGFSGAGTPGEDNEGDDGLSDIAYLILPSILYPGQGERVGETLLRLTNDSPATGEAVAYLMGEGGEVEVLRAQVPGESQATFNLSECLYSKAEEVKGLLGDRGAGASGLRLQLKGGLRAEAWARVPGLRGRSGVGPEVSGEGERMSTCEQLLLGWDGKVREALAIMNPGERAARVRLRWRRPGEEEKVLARVIPSKEVILIETDRTEGSGTFIPVGSELEVDSDEKVVADRWVLPRDPAIEGFLASRALLPLSDWRFGSSLKGYEVHDYLTLWNGGRKAARVKASFIEKGVEVGRWEGELRGMEGKIIDLNSRLGYAASCDAIALHPYKSPGNWAPFYSRIRGELNALGVDKELVVTEVGWPHRHDEQPAAFSEQMQSAALGSWGLGPLLEAGCRKVWLYKLVDEPPGKSWDKCYYGLFDHQGHPHPSWAEFKRLQENRPDYPALSGRGWSPP